MVNFYSKMWKVFAPEDWRRTESMEIWTNKTKMKRHRGCHLFWEETPFHTNRLNVWHFSALFWCVWGLFNCTLCFGKCKQSVSLGPELKFWIHFSWWRSKRTDVPRRGHGGLLCPVGRVRMKAAGWGLTYVVNHLEQKTPWIWTPVFIASCAPLKIHES